MPYAENEGVKLYFEEAGAGTPIIFLHEFAADLRSWEAQMRAFSRTHRCVAVNARTRNSGRSRKKIWKS